MKAIQIRETGGPEVLQLVDLPDPQVGPGQVRVKAEAIGVGRPDILMRNGTYKWMPPLPAIPGAEMAGQIDQVGAGVTSLAVGDRVLLSARDLPQRGGCYAQYIVAPEEAPYALPAGISFDHAVSLPNLQLAVAMLLGLHQARSDLRAVLITGAAGGVATMLAQLARHLGAVVIGTARSEAKRAFALRHGFDQVLDPALPDLPGRVRQLTDGRGVVLALDAIGSQSFIDCINSLAANGTAVSYNIVAGPPSQDVFAVLRKLLGLSLGVRCFSMHTLDQNRGDRRALMQRAIALMAAGHVRAPEATVMPLAAVKQAHGILDAGNTIGKIILKP